MRKLPGKFIRHRHKKTARHIETSSGVGWRLWKFLQLPEDNGIDGGGELGVLGTVVVVEPFVTDAGLPAIVERVEQVLVEAVPFGVNFRSGS